jgi:eukaryotic-like serine/threonine-protein kinase
MPQFNPPLADAEIDGAFPRRFVGVAAIYAGGQGSVFRVERPDGTVGALKIYAPDPGAEIEERTDREVEALTRIVRPTIVRLDDHGTVTIRNEACRFVCTTFIDGVPLSTHFGPQNALVLDAVSRIGHDVADAIEALWAAPHRIVHRDIKPQNVMLANNGHAVLIDLGVARHTTLESLTLTGGTWGTRGYMSPEQAATRKALTCKSDVFTLGVLMQQCLAGIHPTNGNQQILRAGGVPTSSITNGIPAPIVQLIDSMVLRDSNRRPMPDHIKAILLPHARPVGRAW